MAEEVETSQELVEVFAEAFIWKCERKILAAEEKAAGQKLALGLAASGRGRPPELCVVAADGRKDFESRHGRISCPRVLTLDPDNGSSWTGATIQADHVWTSSLDHVLLSDLAVREEAGLEAKKELFRRASYGDVSAALETIGIQDPVELVLDWSVRG